jgi:LmbE family N-acetylglucosaminyl deacetylase
MEYIFISPHLDDVSFSCGGIVHQLSKSGNKVQIWTIFAGDPPSAHYPDFASSLHHRWKLTRDIVKVRRNEDLASCEILGANAVHFSYPDCIYRIFENNQPVIQKETDLYQEVLGNQRLLINEISNQLKSATQPDHILVAPLSIGNHIDHRIVNKSVNKVENDLIYYYTDYPYNLKSDVPILSKIPENYIQKSFTLAYEDIVAWQNAVSAYHSQISTFWADENHMVKEIMNYAMEDGGNHLWIPAIKSIKNTNKIEN